MGIRFMRKAQVKRGKAREAQEFGAAIADHWQQTYGTTLTWGFEVGGDVNMMYWFADHASMAALEAEMMASMTNEETSKLLAETTDLLDGHTQDRIILTM
jgi:hypothetical protein